MCQTYIRLLRFIYFAIYSAFTFHSLCLFIRLAVPAAWVGPLIFRYHYLNRVGGRALTTDHLVMQPFLQPDICLIGRCGSFQEAALICIALFDIITF